MPRLRKPAMILSAAEQQLIEAIRYTRKLTVIVQPEIAN
jgi:hypothetical protein